MVFHTSVRFSQTAIRGLLGLVCLGVGLAVVFSERACQASCGDYVILRGSDASGKVMDRTTSIPLHRKLPCNSPVCRGEVPQLPVPAAPPSQGPTEKPLALFADSLDLEGNSPRCDWFATSDQARPGYRSPLERPPSLEVAFR